MKKIAVLVSGSGTNLAALIGACENNTIKDGKISLVLSSNPNAYALQRAKLANVKTKTVDRQSFQNSRDFNKKLLEVLKEENPDLVVLAGFMCILEAEVTRYFKNKMINVHPSLIPAFCGKGFYGLRVHEAALKRGVKLAGATVHFVNEVADGGPIIMQKCVAVRPDDTPRSLQKRVMQEAEWVILPEVVSLICSEKIKIKNNITYIEV